MLPSAGRHPMDERDLPSSAMGEAPSDGDSEVSDDASILAKRADADLVDGVRRGDARAVAAFYDRVHPIIDRKLRRLLGIHDADFDDMMQNSLIELIRSRDRFRGEGSLEGWVAVVSSRVVYRQIRERRSERRIFAATPADQTEQTTADPDAEEQSATLELLARVRGHLDALDPVKAWTYILHDVIGHSLAEVAEITNASLSATQSRLFRGRRDLEERLAANGELAASLRATATGASDKTGGQL
jgi:RNA polymerase sigma factor (sigma-70 family)